MLNILWLQPFQCEDLVVFSVLYHCKLALSFGLSVEQNKTFDDVILHGIKEIMFFCIVV